MASGRKKNKSEKRDYPFDGKGSDNPSISMPLDKAEDYFKKKEETLEGFISDFKKDLKNKDGELSCLRSEMTKVRGDYANFREQAAERMTYLQGEVRRLNRESRTAKFCGLLYGICLSFAGIIFGCWLNQNQRETFYLVCAILFALIGVGLFLLTLKIRDTKNSDRT
jgi:hypothetical protein